MTAIRHNRFLSLLLAGLTLCLLLPLSAAALSDAPRLTDDADLLTPAEEASLLALLDEQSEIWEFDITVCTVDSLEGKDALTYADDFYDTMGYGYTADSDGILFLIAMEEREWAFSTCGYGITVFSDYDLDILADRLLPDLSGGNYARAFEIYVNEVTAILDYAATYGSDFSESGYIAIETHPYEDYYPDESYESTPMPLGQRLLICLALGVGIAFLVLAGMTSQMKTVRSRSAAGEYTRQDSFHLTHSGDLFLYRNVNRVRRQQDSGSSHRGGGSSHVSSAGRSHGGRSGRF